VLVLMHPQDEGGDPFWIEGDPEPWPDHSWVGVESTRRAIQRRVALCAP
jgi:hypothetical protein